MEPEKRKRELVFHDPAAKEPSDQLPEVEIDLDLVQDQWGGLPGVDGYKRCKRCRTYRPLKDFEGKRHFVEGINHGVHVSQCLHCRDIHARSNRKRREKKAKNLGSIDENSLK